MSYARQHGDPQPLPKQSAPNMLDRRFSQPLQQQTTRIKTYADAAMSAGNNAPPNYQIRPPLGGGSLSLLPGASALPPQMMMGQIAGPPSTRSFASPFPKIYPQQREMVPPGSQPPGMQQSQSNNPDLGVDPAVVGAQPSMTPGFTQPTMTPGFARLPELSSIGTQQPVTVIVRSRPFNVTELSRGDRDCVNILDDGSTVQVSTETVGSKMAKAWKFDSCLSESVQQEGVFEKCKIKNLLDSALHGYSATVFAYGQTGSGKTYTMSGPEHCFVEGQDLRNQAGIIPRSIRYLFSVIDSIERTRFTIKAAYLEIYNEQVRDMLNPTTENLAVRWSTEKGFFVENLLVVECNDSEDLVAVFQEGTKNRVVGSHDMNKDSSRSHSMMTIHLDSVTMDQQTGRMIKKHGKISFVDLAGSERLKETNSSGVTLKETTNINRSLFALGNVISALGDPKKKDTHIPYRNSKLTKLLMDSLGGSSLTLMIACIAASHRYLEETLNTLMYASRTKNIHNKPLIQMDQKEAVIVSMRQEILLLREENSFLRTQLNLSPSARLDLSSLTSENGLTSPHKGSQLPPLLQPPSTGQSARSRVSAPEVSQRNVSQYAIESQRLNMENARLEEANQRLQMEYEQVMQENDTLVAKIDNLETVFMDPASEWDVGGNRGTHKRHSHRYFFAEVEDVESQLQSALETNKSLEKRNAELEKKILLLEKQQTSRFGTRRTALKG